MNVRNIYGPIAVLVLCAGCMVGKKYSSPTAPQDITYRVVEPRDTMPLDKWFEVYEDTALKGMIQTTLDSNKDLHVAAARIEASRAEMAVVKANMFPQLGYSGKAGGGHAGTDAQKVAGGIEGAVFNAFGVLSWEPDLWGKFRHANRAAQAQYEATQQERNALQVSLIAEVAANYFLLRDLDNRLSIAQQTLIGRKDNTKIITDRYNKGYIAEIDQLQAIQQESIAAAAIPSLERQIVQTENAIRLLMGMGPGEVPRGYSNFEQILSPDIPVGLPSQLLERRPDVMAAEKIMHAQFEQIGVAQANRFPSISLTGVLGFASPELSSFIGNGGMVANGFGSITGPLFTFFQRKNAVIAERKRYDQTFYAYQQTVLAAFRDVDNALAYYRTYAEEYEQLRIMVVAARKALILSKAKYDSGYTSYIDVILMENNLFDAQFQESRALQGKLNATVLLYKALGGGW